VAARHLFDGDSSDAGQSGFGNRTLQHAALAISAGGCGAQRTPEQLAENAWLPLVHLRRHLREIAGALKRLGPTLMREAHILLLRVLPCQGAPCS